MISARSTWRLPPFFFLTFLLSFHLPLMDCWGEGVLGTIGGVTDDQECSEESCSVKQHACHRFVCCVVVQSSGPVCALAPCGLVVCLLVVVAS